MTTVIDDYSLSERPHRILEVGAGTGAMTKEILHKMGPKDTLVIYELSTDLALVLHREIARFSAVKKGRVEIRVCAFPEKLDDETFDFAICSLPFNNFPSTEVRRILKCFAHCLEGGGMLTYFEYCHLRAIKLKISAPRERIRLRRIEYIFADFLAAHRISRKTVRLNIPPAWVHILRFE